MSFWTPQALAPLAQSESGGNASLIHYPSGYTTSGVRSSASGLFGYLDSTWQTYAAQAGVDTNLYPRAYMAPASVQQQVALITPVENWTCPGCNATASRLATDPSNVTGSPLTGSDPLGSSVTQNNSGTSSTSGSATGTPIQTSLQPQETSFITSTVNQIESAFGGAFSKALTAAETAAGTWLGSVQNWFIRAAVIFLGIVLIALALVVIMWDHGGEAALAKMQKAAAA